MGEGNDRSRCDDDSQCATGWNCDEGAGKDYCEPNGQLGKGDNCEGNEQARARHVSARMLCVARGAVSLLSERVSP